MKEPKGRMAENNVKPMPNYVDKCKQEIRNGMAQEFEVLYQKQYAAW